MKRALFTSMSVVVLVAFACLGATRWPQTVSAHVVLRDANTRTGTVLHVVPDDDPVAGEAAELLFDIDDERVTGDVYAFQLTVSSDSTRDIVPITTAGSSVHANYVFPRQGLYHIELTAHPGKAGFKPLRFEHSQRVSRGLSGGSAGQVTHTWAEIGLVASIISLLALGIVAYNKRDLLAAYARKHH